MKEVLKKFMSALYFARVDASSRINVGVSAR
jgi:hypothetical protein